MVNKILYFLIIPLGYIFFSFYTLKHQFITEEKMNFIKWLYYSIWILIIVLTIYSIEPYQTESMNPLGIPNFFWHILLISITGILLAIIFDFLIIIEFVYKKKIPY